MFFSLTVVASFYQRIRLLANRVAILDTD